MQPMVVACESLRLRILQRSLEQCGQGRLWNPIKDSTTSRGFISNLSWGSSRFGVQASLQFRVSLEA